VDAIVAAALKKWPNVPHCYGWLALDARGDWYMRDDRVQAEGPFPQVKGSRIEHEKLREFIARNYASDESGAAPYVWRLAAAAAKAPAITSHVGTAAQFRSAQVDERGRVFLDTDAGYGLVHTLDIEAASDAIERGLWAPEPVAFADLPARFGYRLRAAGQEAHPR